MVNVVKSSGSAIGGIVLMSGAVLASYSPPFKEAATHAATIAVVRCQAPGLSDVQCLVDRVVRGAVVNGPVIVAKRAWERYRFRALEAEIDKVEFLMLLNDRAREMCFGDMP